MRPLTKKEKKFCFEVGQRIVEIRKSKKLTQKKLADMLEIEDSALRRIEKGRTNPTLITLNRIATELQIPISCFLTSTD